MTTAYNNIVRSVAPKSVFPAPKAMLGAASDWNQGDLLTVDTGVIRAVAATTDSTNFVGVAVNTVVDGKTKSPYLGTAVDAAMAVSEIAGPTYGVVVKLIMNTGDAFAVGCKVYLTTDAQTVTSVDPGNAEHIGIYQGALVASAASGQTGEFLIGCRYGTSALVF